MYTCIYIVKCMFCKQTTLKITLLYLQGEPIKTGIERRLRNHFFASNLYNKALRSYCLNFLRKLIVWLKIKKCIFEPTPIRPTAHPT